MDSYYGQTQSSKVPPFNFNSIIDSKTYQSLLQLSRSTFVPISSTFKMRSLREQATIRCGVSLGPMSPSPCPNGPCLFNLETDPCEKVNVAFSRQDISSQLYELLKFYRTTLVPQINKPVDTLQADPKRFNDTWNPWIY